MDLERFGIHIPQASQILLLAPTGTLREGVKKRVWCWLICWFNQVFNENFIVGAYLQSFSDNFFTFTTSKFIFISNSDVLGYLIWKVSALDESKMIHTYFSLFMSILQTNLALEKTIWHGNMAEFWGQKGRWGWFWRGIFALQQCWGHYKYLIRGVGRGGGWSGLAGVVLILKGGQMPDGHNNWLLFTVSWQVGNILELFTTANF